MLEEKTLIDELRLLDFTMSEAIALAVSHSTEVTELLKTTTVAAVAHILCKIDEKKKDNEC